MEDEYHVLFECPTYHHIRLKYEEALFSNFGGVSRAARSMRPSGKVSAFMNQNPRKVAAFVSECLDYRRFEASDLLPYATRETLEELGLVGYQIDTFSSDYDDYMSATGCVPLSALVKYVAVCVRVCWYCHQSGGTDVVDLPDILLPAGQYLDLFDSESETDVPSDSSDEELVEV